MEPGYQESEIDFLLQTINPFLAGPLDRTDILSIFSGLRPLVTGSAASTSKLSREHYIDSSSSDLITIAGGKWTTYRKMAEDVIDFAARKGLLPPKKCVSMDVKVHGAPSTPGLSTDASDHMARYGSDAPRILEWVRNDASLGTKLDAALPFTLAEVVFAAREEMARTVEDVLSRRTRALLLDARAAQRAAATVAKTMAAELGKDEAWVGQQVEVFDTLARSFYQLN